MSDTLIFARQDVRPPLPPEPEAPTAPIHPRSFAARLQRLSEAAPPAVGEPHVEVLEAVQAGERSLLGIINAVLAKENPSRNELLAMRAQLRRYSSEVNLLMSLLRALMRDLKPPRR